MFHAEFNLRSIVARLLFIPISLALMAMTGACSQQASEVEGTGGAGKSASTRYPTLHKTIKIDGLDIFYREAGPQDAPTILLLHGFPTSSHMFRNLIPQLSDRFHLVAPDYPGALQAPAPGGEL